MEYDEAEALLEDVRLSLENDRKFYEWCSRHLKNATSYVVSHAMNSFYRQFRKLTSVQKLWLHEYFKWRFLTDCTTPPPVLAKPWSAHEHTTKYVVTKDDKGTVIMDFTEIEHRLAAHIAQETIARANGDARLTAFNKPIKESPVSKLTFKQQFLLNGTDITSIPNDQIYVLIQQEETRIANLEKIQTKPKRLLAEIDEAKANLAAIVAHLDK